MTRWIAAAFAAALALVVVIVAVARSPAPNRAVDADAASAPSGPAQNHPGFIYGRVTTGDGESYEGRLRWGRGEEAFWGDFFDGRRDENPWAVHAPGKRRSFEIFGFDVGGRDRLITRPVMVRFGDIARVDAQFQDVKVTLKSGTTFVLDRFEAGDIDDGVRVWDARGGVVDVDARRIRTIEFLPTEPLAGAPTRLHGTVRTRQGDFTGFIQWNRVDGVGADALDGRTAEGERKLRFDTIRSIARRSRDSALVTLLDGREVVLERGGTNDIGQGNSGIYVDDTRYGRVLIHWDAFERIDFSPRDSGPAYTDFPPGQPLTGSVTTRGGRRLAGRLVYDFDESETTESFDVSLRGIDYNIPFGLIASIVPRSREGRGAEHASVILRDGEELLLERNGDLGDGNAGVLIFVDGHERPEQVRWTDVERIDLDRAR